MLRCALCGRSMASAAVLIGSLPIGPRCARRAGLLAPARKRLGLLSLVGIKPKRVEDGQLNLELEVAA